MKKKNKQKQEDFDVQFDSGNIAVDFKAALPTHGLSKAVKLPPMTIPAWLAVEIETISQLQANSKASVVRQLLVEAISAKKKSA